LPQFEGAFSLFFRCIFSGTVDLQSDAVFWQNEPNSGPWKPDLRTSFDMNLHHMVQAIVTVLAVINPVVCNSIFLTLTPAALRKISIRAHSWLNWVYPLNF
jgi:hypothetical protein